MSDIEQDRKFGRIEIIDSNDQLYPMGAMLDAFPISTITEKYWWSDGWWGNQGSTSMCVAFSWTHWVEDGPVIQDKFKRSKPIIQPSKLYTECQLRDQWPGEKYLGTSVRAGAKVLKELGIIKEYRWATDINDIVKCLLVFGPLVVGTQWTSDMSKPKSGGIVTPTGKSHGGHAYMLNGVDTKKELIRIKNSWGQQWGIDGHAFIKFNDFEKLLKSGGEACTALELNLSESVDWTKLSPPSILT